MKEVKHMHSTTTRTLPDLDPSVGTRLGDEILLDVAKTEKVKKVPGRSRTSGAVRSHQARAWTRNGDVD